jgi:hypothetical protein
MTCRGHPHDRQCAAHARALRWHEGRHRGTGMPVTSPAPAPAPKAGKKRRPSHRHTPRPRFIASHPTCPQLTHQTARTWPTLRRMAPRWWPCPTWPRWPASSSPPRPSCERAELSPRVFTVDMCMVWCDAICCCYSVRRLHWLSDMLTIFFFFLDYWLLGGPVAGGVDCEFNSRKSILCTTKKNVGFELVSYWFNSSQFNFQESDSRKLIQF